MFFAKLKAKVADWFCIEFPNQVALEFKSVAGESGFSPGQHGPGWVARHELGGESGAGEERHGLCEPCQIVPLPI
jgi:hypothetical protein